MGLQCLEMLACCIDGAFGLASCLGADHELSGGYADIVHKSSSGKSGAEQGGGSADHRGWLLGYPALNSERTRPR
jgi:hypothetical protein